MDMCAFSRESPWECVPSRKWIRLNYDTGAAVTVFPKSFCKDATGNGSEYRTATGELTPDYGGLRLTGRAENGELKRVAGRLAEVHNAGVCVQVRELWAQRLDHARRRVPHSRGLRAIA